MAPLVGAAGSLGRGSQVGGGEEGCSRVGALLDGTRAGGLHQDGGPAGWYCSVGGEGRIVPRGSPRQQVVVAGGEEGCSRVEALLTSTAG